MSDSTVWERAWALTRRQDALVTIAQLTERMGASIAVTSSQPAAMDTTIPAMPMNARIIASREAGTSASETE